MTDTDTTTHTGTTADTGVDHAIHVEDPRVERTRVAVLAAAVELMLAGGPDAITHASVAAEAEVSRTTVYKHWPTRADLLRSTITELGKSIPDPADFTGDVRHDLTLLLANLVGDLRDEARARLIGMMMARAQHDSTVAAVRDEMVCEVERLFAEVISTGASSGELRGDIDTSMAMASIIGSLIFMRFMANSPIDDAAVARMIDEFVVGNAPR
jgi:AcrR family transcriptional regulator